MLVLRRNKKTVEVAAREAAWHVFEGDHDGRRLYARFNMALRDASDKAHYRIQIGVAIPLRDPDERGLPAGAELEELAAIEEQLVTAVDGRAVLVGTITTNGMREFVPFGQTPDWIEPFHNCLEAQIDDHEVQVMARTDPDWDVYAQFVR